MKFSEKAREFIHHFARLTLKKNSGILLSLSSQNIPVTGSLITLSSLPENFLVDKESKLQREKLFLFPFFEFYLACAPDDWQILSQYHIDVEESLPVPSLLGQPLYKCSNFSAFIDHKIRPLFESVGLKIKLVHLDEASIIFQSSMPKTKALQSMLPFIQTSLIEYCHQFFGKDCPQVIFESNSYHKTERYPKCPPSI